MIIPGQRPNCLGIVEGFTYVGKSSSLNEKKFHGRFVIAMCASILNFETITESNLLINEVFWGHFVDSLTDIFLCNTYPVSFHKWNQSSDKNNKQPITDLVIYLFSFRSEASPT